MPRAIEARKPPRLLRQKLGRAQIDLPNSVELESTGIFTWTRGLNETRDRRKSSATCLAKISTQVFVPEAQRRLAGGGTTGIKPVEPPSPERARDQSRSVAPPGLEALGSQYRWFYHRLISGVPPGRRVIRDLCRISYTVCATLAAILDFPLNTCSRDWKLL